MTEFARLFERKSNPALLALGVGVALLLAEGLCTEVCFGNRESASQRTGQLVAELGLTDIALFSEARYTRHPSQADLFTPFQDAPGSLEHFPAGSLLTPPPHLRPQGQPATRQADGKEGSQ